MSALVWDEVGSRLYEAGINKGVLYQSDGTGVVWNGILGIDEDTSNETEPVYFDGVKYNDIVTIGDFSATLRAFTYPDEFSAYQGAEEDQDGFFFMDQEFQRFGLSYQTRIGNDVDGNDLGYKIHILYNLTAMPTSISRSTLGLEVTPIEFQWAISSIPEEIDFRRPTAHVVLDSRRMDPYLLADIESILYGSDTEVARLPSLKALTAFIRQWDRLIVIDNFDGTWTATTVDEDMIVMTGPNEFALTADSAIYLDADTFTLSSSELNEEDV